MDTPAPESANREDGVRGLLRTAMFVILFLNDAATSACIDLVDALSGMWPLRREMYAEIYRRVTTMQEQLPTLSLPELCARVLRQPAPKFYLTPGTAKQMVCRARKEWQRRKLQRLERHVRR